MTKMTKAQARKRLNEAKAKIKAVYMVTGNIVIGAITTQDMAAIEKIIDKCLKRLN